MRKLFVLCALIGAIGFAGCENPADNGGGENNSDVIGQWVDEVDGALTLEIGKNGDWVVVIGTKSLDGTWTRTGSVLTLKTSSAKFGTATLGSAKLALAFDYKDGDGPTAITYEGTSTCIREGSEIAKLTVKNNSSSTLFFLTWDNTFLAGSFLPTRSTTLSLIKEGSGYLNFTIVNNGKKYRTMDLIAVSDENVEFNITDNTLVVALNDSSNTQKTLLAAVSEGQ